MAAEPVPPEIGIVDLSTVVPLTFFHGGTGTSVSSCGLCEG